MTKQPDLFRPMCATVRTKQPTLFADGPRESALSCGQCGRPLIRTPTGFLCCPAGCGRLIEAVDDAAPCGSWFTEDTSE